MPEYPGVDVPPAGESTVTEEVKRWQADGTVISDATAKAIAQMYHGPKWAATTALGQGSGVCLEDLVVEIVAAHIPEQPDDDSDPLGRPAVRALLIWAADYRKRVS